MQIPFFELRTQFSFIEEDIKKAIDRTFAQMQVIGGEIVTEFEEALAKYSGIPYLISCGNGSDALEVALKALDIGPGDEVLVPALSWYSTAGAVKNVGAEPVFVDVLENEYTLDPSAAAAKINRSTKAIIPVHLYGLPARMEEIQKLALQTGLKIIEDCAQALGATIRGQQVGTFGDLAAFSFYPTKNLGAYGDAGAIGTADQGLAEKCRWITDYGQKSKNDHHIIGRNSRLDTIQAAILSAKLPYLDSWVAKRQTIAERYGSEISGPSFQSIPKDFRHVYHIYNILSENREGLIAELSRRGIGFAIHYPQPLPYLKCFESKKYSTGDFPVAEKICQHGISIPIFPELEEKQIGYIISSFNEFYKLQLT